MLEPHETPQDLLAASLTLSIALAGKALDGAFRQMIDAQIAEQMRAHREVIEELMQKRIVHAHQEADFMRSLRWAFKPRRSGRRHRGTRAWDRRYAHRD